ncbi:MAG: hypothetical protein GX222_04450 [Ruminococcaceae bacterium]|nr:hypothetical protein [Oscillospiraceae bacterium]
MARKRMIDPNFWRDEKIGELSHLERLLFIGLWNFAEDNGAGRANPKLIKADVFPYDSLRDSDIEKALGNLCTLRLITLYDLDGQRYYHIVNFLKHQKINRPSPSPIPLPEETENAEIVSLTEDSLNTHGEPTEDSRLIEENIREEKLREYKRIYEESEVNESSRTFGEFNHVVMTDDEYQKLVGRYGVSMVQSKIVALDTGIENKNSKYLGYKNHYATINSWCRKDVEKLSVVNSQISQSVSKHDESLGFIYPGKESNVV